MAINGRQYDWEDISVNLPSGEAIGITEIKYEDGQEIEARYGKGAKARGYGRKNYSATCTFVLDRDEWERLKGSIATKDIYSHEPFPITVAYANDDMGAITDTLKNCKITKFSGGGASQGDDNASPITCECVVLGGIEWNGTPGKADE